MCSAESTSVIVASVVGVIDFFIIKLGFLPVRWDGILEKLVQLGRRMRELVYLGGRVMMIHRSSYERRKKKKRWNLGSFRYRVATMSSESTKELRSGGGCSPDRKSITAPPKTKKASPPKMILPSTQNKKEQKKRSNGSNKEQSGQQTAKRPREDPKNKPANSKR